VGYGSVVDSHPKDGLEGDPLQFRPDCAHCHRLRLEYYRATTEHIKLEGKLKLAALEHDDETVAVLAPEVEQAAAKRSVARQAIKDHEAVAHRADATSA
jgi:hypothetical protein